MNVDGSLQAKRLGPVHTTLSAIAGKTRPRSHDPDRVSAISGQRGRWLGPIRAAHQNHELPAAQTLGDRRDLEGQLIVPRRAARAGSDLSAASPSASQLAASRRLFVQYWSGLPEGRSLLAGDSGRGHSVKCKIARQRAPTKHRCSSHLKRALSTHRRGQVHPSQGSGVNVRHHGLENPGNQNGVSTRCERDQKKGVRKKGDK